MRRCSPLADADKGPETFGQLPNIVECDQDHQRTALSPGESTERRVPVDQAFGARRHIQHVQDRWALIALVV